MSSITKNIFLFALQTFEPYKRGVIHFYAFFSSSANEFQQCISCQETLPCASDKVLHKKVNEVSKTRIWADKHPQFNNCAEKKKKEKALRIWGKKTGRVGKVMPCLQNTAQTTKTTDLNQIKITAIHQPWICLHGTMQTWSDELKQQMACQHSTHPWH